MMPSTSTAYLARLPKNLDSVVSTLALFEILITRLRAHDATISVRMSSTNALITGMP